VSSNALAWALLANGREAEADAAIRTAMAIGTQDALLYYHAGTISEALGDESRAREMLTLALNLNPGFEPWQANRAREALRGLGG